MSKADGRRDLSLIRASGSTARVLNLSVAFERHGETEAYRAQPLFKNKRLNRSLILKHVVRQSEYSLFDHHTVSATKVILPYSATELGLGGVSLLVGERRFEALLRDAAGGYSSVVDFEHDREVLLLLSRLPSFDPFLMRERMRRAGIEPALCYFELSEADIARMRSFVTREISNLIALAFTGADSFDLAAKMADKLMTDETAQSLDPLRATLKLSGDAYVEGIFAWKGFLYYRWAMQEFKPALAKFRPQFDKFRVMRTSTEERRELVDMRNRISRLIDVSLRRVEDGLGEYSRAFDALGAGAPTAFRDFLLKAPSMFIPIGEAVGVIKHIESFWRFRFPHPLPPIMEGGEALETLQEFETTLESTSFAHAQTPPGVTLI